MLSLVALTLGFALAEDVPAEEAPADAGARTYTLDAGSSRLWVLVKYDRNATIPGHDHVVVAETFDGTVTWDPSDPSACDIDISFPVTALTVDPGNARSWAGLEGETSSGDKSKIRDNFLGKHQLESSKFPKITFASTSCSGSGNTYEVKGNLSIHGVSKPVSTKMTIDAGDSFAAKGSFSTDHATWGMEPYSALLGALKNAPTLTFTVDVKGS